MIYIDMINFTDKAKAQIEEFLFEGYVLRVRVLAGGCSGLRYDMGVIPDTEVTSDDNVIDLQSFKAVVDTKSATYLSGATVDFSNGLNGSGFTFDNPNSKRSCGCNKSFSCG